MLSSGSRATLVRAIPWIDRPCDVDEPEAEAAASGDALDASSAEEAESQTYFQTLPELVDRFLIKAYRRPITASTAWCSEWWKHGEAVCVPSALWRAWEALRLEPGTGRSTGPPV
ncbi:DUF4913 domain-containing protein [Kribbella sp. NPDC000426]|uniref:DUF4913 domain-containing protein n=1 Tax=Kribbella sp. NPDC000426 TaxID=3154255 RepID=UPI00332F29E1